MGGISLAQSLVGLIDRKKAQKSFESAKMPDYTQSDAYKTAQRTANLAERFAQEGLPEEVLRFQEDMIGRSSAASLSGAGSLRQGVAGIGGTAMSLADQYRGLASMDANAQIAQRSQYLTQLNNFQKEQRYGFENEIADYVNRQAARLARMSGGMNMINSGLGGMSQSLASLIDTGMFNTTGNAKFGKPDNDKRDNKYR
jgi:predicted transcriptional regulator